MADLARSEPHMPVYMTEQDRQWLITMVSEQRRLAKQLGRTTVRHDGILERLKDPTSLLAEEYLKGK